MSRINLAISRLQIPFRSTFRHASASRSLGEGILVSAMDENNGIRGFGEGCPRSYVTGETIASVQTFFTKWGDSLSRNVHDFETLVHWAEINRTEIDANPAAWCAIEMALLDCFARRANQSVESLIGLPEVSGTLRYSAVLGDSPIEEFSAQVTRYLQQGFGDFKIKLSGDLSRDREKVSVLHNAGIDAFRVRWDANNLWRDPEVVVAHLNGLGWPVGMIEEPLRAGDVKGMQVLQAATGVGIILDESLLRREQLALLPRSGRWIANIRVSKMGGVLRSLSVARAAGEQGLEVIVGAQVGESSLLTRSAWPVAQSVGGNLRAQEGAFGTFLLSHDIWEPSLRFGRAGLLDAVAALGVAVTGWGLALTQHAWDPARTTGDENSRELAL